MGEVSKYLHLDTKLEAYQPFEESLLTYTMSYGGRNQTRDLLPPASYTALHFL